MKSLLILAVTISLVGAIAHAMPVLGSNGVTHAEGFTNESFEGTATTKIDYDVSGLSGTVWQNYQTIYILPFPSIFSSNDNLHFYGGRCYGDYKNMLIPGAFYVDLLGVSFYFYFSPQPLLIPAYSIGIMLPVVGRGIIITGGITHFFPVLEISLYNKTDDYWVPPEVE